MEAIIRNKINPLAELVRKPEDLQRAAIGFIRAIGNSFQQDQDRTMLTILKSDVEVERRFRICEEWFRVMRADMGYSLDRTLDFMPHALRCTLDGVSFEPPKAEGTGWAPSVLREDLVKKNGS